MSLTFQAEILQQLDVLENRHRVSHLFWPFRFQSRYAPAIGRGKLLDHIQQALDFLFGFLAHVNTYRILKGAVRLCWLGM